MRYFFLLFTFLVGCSQTSISEGEKLSTSLSSEPSTLDPRKARDIQGVVVLNMLFEGLTRLSKEGVPEKALVQDYTLSEDGLTYTFHLKKTKWSDGNPLKAFDFERSWKTILDPNFPTDLSFHLYVVKNARLAKNGKKELDEVGVKALDPLTLEVKLENPTPYFLELLTMTPFLPTPSKLEDSQGHLISNGPFILKEWNHSDSLKLEKNPHYWEKKQVHLKEVDFFVLSEDTALNMYQEGKLDWFGSPLGVVPPESILTLKERNILHIDPFLGTYFFRVNVSEEIHGKKNPLANEKLRKALSYSIDRGAITEHVLQGGQKPAFALVPPEQGLNSKVKIDEKLVEEIKGTLKEPLKLSYVNSERNQAVAQVIQKQWEKKLGIQVELEAVEAKVYFQRISTKDYQIAAGSWIADFNDPINFLEVFKFKNAGSNNTGWENREYIELLDQSQVCQNLGERRKFLQKAEEILMDETPIIPLFYFSMNYVKNERLKDVALSPKGLVNFRSSYFENAKNL